MKVKAIIVIVFGCLVLLVAAQLRGRPPSLPRGSEAITISLYEPYSEDLIVEKTISDQGKIEALVGVLSGAKSSGDHKCPSIGTISLLTSSGTGVLKVLPGHDSARYEFRFEGGIYSLPRVAYIDALVAAGIDRKDILLEGTPEHDPETEEN
ncbi:MAG: hypothetical protein P1U86_14755 [Verrucomicrobiales bacterium]|nr:hypothetical protein [Verrucomicrobiales bacterium]